MGNLVVTGGSGFLGSALIDRLLAKGHRVISVSRHPPQLRENMVHLVGDIIQPNLGLNDGNFFAVTNAGKISAFYHLAAIHHLGKDRDGLLWKTNIGGTKNVIEFCVRHNIPHLYFTSTAYTQGRNTYERSKALCEHMLLECDIPTVTIFKPSVVMGTAENPYPGHFSQFVELVVKVHQRAELVRRKIEGTLRLPVIEPVFRIKGNPIGRLNLIQAEEVARGMANIDDIGTFWLTHPNPPALGELLDWIGESIMVRLKFVPDFKPTPIEAVFRKMLAPFSPYLEGDNFPSDLPLAPPITKEFIQDTIKRSLLD